MADFRPPSRIEIKSKRIAGELMLGITSDGIETTALSYELKDKDKPEWQQRFKEIYEETFRDCVSVDGQVWSEVDEETTEFEPVDLEKKEYINGELTNHLHHAIMEVAAKRKHYPSKYRSCLSKTTVSELYRLGQLKVTCDTSTEHFIKPDSMSEEVLDRLSDSGRKMSSLIENSEKELNKAKNLQTVTNMTMKNSTRMNHQEEPLTDLQNMLPKKLRLHTVKKPRTRLKLL